MLQAAKVEQAGKMKGADKITLKANSIAFGGRQYEIVTTYVESKGSGEGKKTARKVGRRRRSRRHRSAASPAAERARPSARRAGAATGAIVPARARSI